MPVTRRANRLMKEKSNAVENRAKDLFPRKKLRRPVESAQSPVAVGDSWKTSKGQNRLSADSSLLNVRANVVSVPRTRKGGTTISSKTVITSRSNEYDFEPDDDEDTGIKFKRTGNVNPTVKSSKKVTSKKLKKLPGKRACSGESTSDIRRTRHALKDVKLENAYVKLNSLKTLIGKQKLGQPKSKGKDAQNVDAAAPSKQQEHFDIKISHNPINSTDKVVSCDISTDEKLKTTRNIVGEDSNLSQDVSNRLEESYNSNIAGITEQHSQPANSIIHSKKSVAPSSFYSNKSIKYSQLRSWLSTAHVESTPSEVSVLTKTGSIIGNNSTNHHHAASNQLSEDIENSVGTELVKPRKPLASAIYSKKSVASSSFYSKKSIATPRLRSWLKTANMESTPSTELTERLCPSKSIKMTSKSKVHSMQALNSVTPINRPTQQGNSRKPLHEQHDDLEYMFGFENLLEPAATLLQDVSSLPQPLLPKTLRDRKEARKKEVMVKTKEFLKASNEAHTPIKRNYRTKVPTPASKGTTLDPDDHGSDFLLYQVAPIDPYSPFKLKDIDVFDEPEKHRRKIVKTVRNKMTPLNIENALPWEEIMEHDLAVESA